MPSFLILEGEISLQSVARVIDGAIALQIHLFIFHGSPEPFGKDIVHTPPDAIHTNGNVVREKDGGVFLRGILRSLVRVVNVGNGACKGGAKRRRTESALHRWREFPCDDIPREPV